VSFYQGFLARKDRFVLRDQRRQDAARDACGKMNLLVEVRAAGRVVAPGRLLRCPERDDETGRNEARRPHLWPVRPVVVAADL
jgi:hypothetical protein